MFVIKQLCKTHALILSTITLFVLFRNSHATAITLDLDNEEEYLDQLEEEPFFVFNSSFPDPSVLRRIGEISGVYALNSSHIYVFHRADRAWNDDDFDDKNIYTKQNLGPIKKPTIALLINGKIAQEFGEGIFFLPHSITADHEGNLWTTDVALHQVFKFNMPDFSKPVLVLGERFKPGNDDKHFCKPTDVKVSSNGDFFVSDGYCNNRVMKFKADATLVTYWGQESLSLPHSLALMPERDLILVADRENNRLLAYTACEGQEIGCGELVREWPLPEAIYAVDVHKDEIYALLGGQESSFVQIFLFEMTQPLDQILGERHGGFGMGHTVSALRQSSGFVVGSLVPECLPGMSCALSAVKKQKSLHGSLYLYQQA